MHHFTKCATTHEFAAVAARLPVHMPHVRLQGAAAWSRKPRPLYLTKECILTKIISAKRPHAIVWAPANLEKASYVVLLVY
jgi:hypothetical protein